MAVLKVIFKKLNLVFAKLLHAGWQQGWLCVRIFFKKFTRLNASKAPKFSICLYLPVVDFYFSFFSDRYLFLKNMKFAIIFVQIGIKL